MPKIIKSILIAAVISALPAYAQDVTVIVGPFVEGHPGTILTYGSAIIDADIWFRTEPGTAVQAFHLPISTKDEAVGERIGVGPVFGQFSHWVDCSALAPNVDPLHNGYTNQSVIALCTTSRNYDHSIDTEGAWMRSFILRMRAHDCEDCDEYFPDAFAVSYHPRTFDPIFVDLYALRINPDSCLILLPGIQYVPNPCASIASGDFNSDGSFNIGDILDAFDKLKYGNNGTACLLECPLGTGTEWPVAMDLNNSCSFNLADVVIAYRKIRGDPINFEPCIYCPPR